MPRAAAASSAAIANPLLCDAKPTCPGAGGVGATVALSAISGRGLATPRQFGPSMRIPAARQTASRSSTSVKPGVRTTRARTPLAAQARAASTTAAAGTASTASSTSPSTAASAPASSTRCSGRVKPPARRLRTTSAPGGPDVPITATEAGRRTCETAARPASRWRTSKRRRAPSDSDVGNSTCTSPSDRCAATAKPESRNTPSMRWFSDRTVAVNVPMPWSEAACARCASSTVASPCPCQASATAKATSARSGVSRKYVACATTVPSRSAISASPSCGAAALRAAASRFTPALKKRNQRDISDSDARKARSRDTSSVVDGRTCTVEPSRSAMSVSITGAIASRSSQPSASSAGFPPPRCGRPPMSADGAHARVRA